MTGVAQVGIILWVEADNRYMLDLFMNSTGTENVCCVPGIWIRIGEFISLLSYGQWGPTMERCKIIRYLALFKGLRFQ